MSKRDDFMETLLDCPWWVSAGLGTIVWGGSLALLANTPTETVGGKMIHAFGSFHWLIPMLFGLLAMGSYLLAGRKRLLLARNRGLERIRHLNWKQFEVLTGQYFREQGYRVEEQGGGGPDGGVDLLLRRGDEKLIVQCKHWKSFCVGIREVKELFATVWDREATGGILVTTSVFSKEAKAFAIRHSDVKLFDGNDLNRVLGVSEVDPAPVPSGCGCPVCGSEMVRRTARRGRSAGGEFWGCPRFPACNGTRSLAAAS